MSIVHLKPRTNPGLCKSPHCCPKGCYVYSTHRRNALTRCPTGCYVYSPRFGPAPSYCLTGSYVNTLAMRLDTWQPFGQHDSSRRNVAIDITARQAARGFYIIPRTRANLDAIPLYPRPPHTFKSMKLSAKFGAAFNFPLLYAFKMLVVFLTMELSKSDKQYNFVAQYSFLSVNQMTSFLKISLLSRISLLWVVAMI